jgi:GTPase SAR1 family protein
MTAADVPTQLAQARATLAELAAGVERLAGDHPEAFDDPEIRRRLDAFRAASAEAKDRLAAPTLSIATLGTTSSGKSTLVNALVGRRLAPIEAAEASAGVLVLRHGTERRLTVEATEGANWDVGSWSPIEDDAIYTRVRDGIMRRYHAQRREKTCAAPQVIIGGPLLPGADAALLGLPAGLPIEFIDLPGLKSVQDRANLAVIQTRVHKAFSLVTLDYSDADDEHRKRLLEELQRVVEHLHGRPDSMIFVLNRVDRRSHDDVPLDERVEVLEREIQEVLGLRERPEVIPMNAQLLYYAQCAWGAGALDGEPLTSSAQQTERLRHLFVDCATSLKLAVRESPEMKRWLATVEDRVDAAKAPTVSDLRKLVQHARDWSGGTRLWARLRARVSESFAELVLLPALVEVFDTYDTFAAVLQTVAEVRRIKTVEEANAQRSKLDDLRRKLHEEVGSTRERFRGRLSEATQQLKLRDPSLRHQLTKQLGPGFESLLNAVDDVRSDLNLTLIVPLRDALKQNRSTYDVEETAAKVVNAVLARDIGTAYDRFSRQLPGMVPRDGALTLRVRPTDQEGVARLEAVERDAKRIFQAMREALSARAEFVLQAKAEKIRGSLTGLLAEQETTLRTICDQLVPGFQMTSAIAATASGRIHASSIRLPETFFALPQAVDLRTPVEKEVVGQREEVRTTGTCFKNRHIERVDVHGHVEYKEVLLPDADAMAQLWSKGVDAGEASLWENLRDWMTDALNESSAAYNGAIDAVLTLAQRTLDEQAEAIRRGFEALFAKWKSIETGISALANARNALHASALSKRAAMGEVA